jgi:hypothetical protein
MLNPAASKQLTPSRRFFCATCFASLAHALVSGPLAAAGLWELMMSDPPRYQPCPSGASANLGTIAATPLVIMATAVTCGYFVYDGTSACHLRVQC